MANSLTEISGQTLANFLDVTPEKYNGLYPNYGKKEYCPCKDLNTDECNGMITVMDALSLEKITGFPIGTKKISKGKYVSGEVWRDNHFNTVFLYIGKLPNKKDVVMNLGGMTGSAGSIEIGKINQQDERNIIFDEKLFPEYFS
jgi:hypothetical protein